MNAPLNTESRPTDVESMSETNDYDSMPSFSQNESPELLSTSPEEEQQILSTSPEEEPLSMSPEEESIMASQEDEEEPIMTSPEEESLSPSPEEESIIESPEETNLSTSPEQDEALEESVSDVPTEGSITEQPTKDKSVLDKASKTRTKYNRTKKRLASLDDSEKDAIRNEVITEFINVLKITKRKASRKKFARRINGLRSDFHQALNLLNGTNKKRPGRKSRKQQSLPLAIESPLPEV